MALEKLCILNTDQDPSKFLDQACEFVKRVTPNGVVTDAMLHNLHKHDVELSQGQINSLLRKEDIYGNYRFIPKTKEKLYQLASWKILDNSTKNVILQTLWQPSHFQEIPLAEIFQQPELCEEIYAQVNRLLKERTIRIKSGPKLLKAIPRANTPEGKKEHLAFLAAVEAMDTAYLHHRQAALQFEFFEAVTNLFGSTKLMLSIAKDISLRDLEIYHAEPNPDTKKEFAKECCRRSGCRTLIRQTVKADKRVELFLNDHRRRIDEKILCDRHGKRQVLEAWNIYCMVENLSFEQTMVFVDMESAKNKLTAIQTFFQKSFTESIPDKLQRTLGESLVEKLHPGSLCVIVEALAEEDIKIDKLEQEDHKPPQGSLLKTFAWKLQYLTESSDQPAKHPSFILGLLRALDDNILTQLTPSKLQFIMAIDSSDFLAKINKGFAQFLPHIKNEKVIPLASIFGTPLWDIVKAFRFVNHIDNSILERMDYLSKNNLLDTAFARFLADCFKKKVEQLRLYHIEEVEKNKDVILFFKERFLALKKGVVKIVTQHIALVKKHTELVPLFFLKSAEQLALFFEDSYRLGKFIGEMEKVTKRKIILE